MDIHQLQDAERRVIAARLEQVQALVAYRQHLAAHLAAHIADIEQMITAIEAGHKPDVPQFEFTDREKDVIRCLISGITTGEAIGKALGMGERTVRTHIYSIMNTTGIRSRAELAVRFKEWWS